MLFRDFNLDTDSESSECDESVPIKCSPYKKAVYKCKKNKTKPDLD